ncbi:MAG: hypothetical protein EB127_20135 [Alphaproteobacteria bacterium]|nr:hypothetical protein [Alphaproteobacteria bacterium]
MATKIKTSKTRVKKTEKVLPSLTTPEAKSGTVQGVYSTSVYANGELVSFEIDWDKLKDHLKTV